MPKQLKASVKLDTRDAIASLKRLEQRINAVNKAVNKQATTSTKLDKSIERASRTAEKLHRANEKAANSAAKIHKNYQKSGTAVSFLAKKVGMLAKTYLGIMGAKAAITVSDNVTRAENQLNNLPGGSPERTAATMDKVYAAAMRSRSDYSGMLSDVGKLMTLSGEAFQNNEDNAIRFQEIMAKSYALGNMSAAEQASSMYQLTQALGSGVLQGDELRSVREGAALAYQQIEKFAQGVFKTDESLKELASQGLITSDIVVAAIMNAEDEINKSFENTNRTFADLGKAIKSNAVKAFEPVGQALNRALNTGAFANIATTLGMVFNALAKAILFVFSILEAVFNFVADNWTIIAKVILSIAAIIAVALLPKLVAQITYLAWAAMYYIVVGAQAVWAAIQTAAAWAIANWPLLLMLAILAIIIITIIWVADSFVDACGIIVGAIFWVLGVIHNIVAFIINLMFGLLTLICGIAYNIGVAFVNAFYSAKAAFWEWVGECLNGTGLIARAVSKIAELFGLDQVSIDQKISASKSKMLEPRDLEASVNASNIVPYTDLGDMYDKGYGYGAKGGQWVSDKVSGIGDLISNSLGMGGSEGLPNPYDPAYDITGGYDPSGANDDIANGLKKLGNIDDNTGSIADSMELTDEDLDYLRKIAEQEWKREYTTANIVVDMTNNNTVNGDGDLDGIVTRLADKLYEEMDYLANGVYAY